MRAGKYRFAKLQIVLAALIVGAALVITPQEQTLSPTPAGADEWRRVHVIDGDTIEAGGRRFRLANIDTPETGDLARCAAERRLGQRATARARALLGSAAGIETHDVGRTDVYGRTIAHVLIDGRDLGDVLVSEGLARPWRGRREPWCDANNRLLR